MYGGGGAFVCFSESKEMKAKVNIEFLKNLKYRQMVDTCITNTKIGLTDTIVWCSGYYRGSHMFTDTNAFHADGASGIT